MTIRPWQRQPRDGGSAVVEFVLVGPLVMLVALAILQVCVSAYVRSTLASAASQGARAVALAGSDSGLAENRIRSVLGGGLTDGVVQTISVRKVTVSGVPMVSVRVDANVPGVGLLGGGPITAMGHAVIEAES